MWVTLTIAVWATAGALILAALIAALRRPINEQDHIFAAIDEELDARERAERRAADALGYTHGQRTNVIDVTRTGPSV